MSIKLNIPTILTLFRIALIPLFIISFYIPFQWSNFLTMLIFSIAGITDWFDGYLARKLNQTTRFGAFLDPVADKIIVVTALALVIEHYNAFWITLPAIVIIAREIIISALREWMAQINASQKVAVSWIGKVKTTAQLLALSGLLWRESITMEAIAVILLYVAAILTVWSMLIYLKLAKNNF